MTRTIRLALVIARRDYVATVWSRAFLLFLLGPLMILAFVSVFGAIGNKSDSEVLRPIITVIGGEREIASIHAAQTRINRESDVLPELRFEAASKDQNAQARALLASPSRHSTVVLSGLPDTPRLAGTRQQIDQLTPDVRALLQEAATAKALAGAGLVRPKIAIAQTAIETGQASLPAGRHVAARIGQTVLFMLTMLLAGMLLSNLVEEKSNKVIEVLAAAVPIDAIFLGKLIAMLGVSLTGIAIWGSIIATLLLTMMPSALMTAAPAVGWPIFIGLGIVYYMMNYMLLGGVFLGIGAQANSVREVQTLSMPVTMAQLVVFALASATLADANGPLGLFAAAFPISSPLTMFARGALEARLWPHLVAIVWQGLWVAIIIRFASRQFRRSVLKSGPARSLFKRGKPKRA